MWANAIEDALEMKQQELKHIQSEREKMKKQGLVDSQIHKDIARLTAILAVLKDVMKKIDEASAGGSTKIMIENFDHLPKSYRSDIISIIEEKGYKCKQKFKDSCYWLIPCFCCKRTLKVSF